MSFKTDEFFSKYVVVYDDKYIYAGGKDNLLTVIDPVSQNTNGFVKNIGLE